MVLAINALKLIVVFAMKRMGNRQLLNARLRLF